MSCIYKASPRLQTRKANVYTVSKDCCAITDPIYTLGQHMMGRKFKNSLISPEFGTQVCRQTEGSNK